MNRLVIIGNGFDLAHGLKTSYKDFINWYWEQRLRGLLTERSDVSSDCLCTLKIIAEDNFGWQSVVSDKEYYDVFNRKWKLPAKDIIEEIANNEEDFYVELCPFFDNITKSIETKGWVDIENEYYKLLKKYADKTDECKELNEQLKFLQDKLVEYLRTQDKAKKNDAIGSLIYSHFDMKDFCVRVGSVSNKIPYVMLLNFNYTNTASLYSDGKNSTVNYIHGSLKNPEEIIFGYGDELDRDYKDILDKNDNELLNYVKSVKYQEANHYKEMLRFIELDSFQVFIMGHSCGNSDRTLLNTIFEHKNCVSIKPFYYQKTDGDNYLEIVQNIYRNFTNMSLYRERVVSKPNCIPLPQSQKQ